MVHDSLPDPRHNDPGNEMRRVADGFTPSSERIQNSMPRSITLSHQTGSAEHLYQPSIERRADGYAVVVVHGRRGTTLRRETMTPQAVSYGHARRIYDGLVAKKLASGYGPFPGPPVPSAVDPPRIGSLLPLRPLRPQLIAPGQAGKILHDPAWGLQEVFRGQRLLLRKTEEGLDGVTTTGRVVRLPEPVRRAAAKTAFDWVMDGVLRGAIFTAFDLPQVAAMNLRSQNYEFRLTALGVLLDAGERHLQMVETFIDRPAKTAFLQRLRAGGHDGVVFKQLSGAYPCGCPAGPDRWLQCLFTAAWPAPTPRP